MYEKTCDKYPPPSLDVSSLLLESLAVGFYYRHISDDGRRTYVYFNRMMRGIFDSEEVPESKYWRQDNEDNHDDIVLRTSEPYRTEYAMNDDSGQTMRWLVFIKRKVKAPENEGGYYIITTVIDITDRKNEELLLTKSRLNLKIATDAGRMSTWDLDVDKRVFSITNGLDIHQQSISLEEHIMLRHNERDGDNASYSDLLDVMAGKKETGEGLYMMRDKDTGEILYRKTHFIGIKSNGKVSHVIGSSQDVTESYRQREIIKENRDELNLALDAGNISAWTYDVKTEMFHTLYGNAIAKSGMSLEETLNILHPDDRAKLTDCIDAIVSGKSDQVSYNFRFKTSDAPSAYRYYDSRMKGRTTNDSVALIIGTQRDITDSFIISNSKSSR